jgi:hypothetical protein
MFLSLSLRKDTQMHIEPGVVNGVKLILSYATAAGASALALKMAASNLRLNGGVPALAMRSIVTTGLVFGSVATFV